MHSYKTVGKLLSSVGEFDMENLIETKVYTCSCGTLVWDTDKHDDFHFREGFKGLF